MFDWHCGPLTDKGRSGNDYIAIDNNTGLLMKGKNIDKTLDNIKFEKEIEILESLNHSNIVKYLGKDTKDNSLFLFTEYFLVGPISRIIEMFGPLDEMMICFIINDLINALTYLHQNKIVHRNLTCKNILLTESGRAKITNFKFSKRFQIDLKEQGLESLSSVRMSEPDTVTVQETPLEINKLYQNEINDYKETEIYKISDIWSIGCIFIEMATGRDPWDNLCNSFSNIYQMISNKNSIIPSELSNNAKDFISCCFESNLSLKEILKKIRIHPFLKSRNHKNIHEDDFIESPEINDHSFLSLDINEHPVLDKGKKIFFYISQTNFSDGITMNKENDDLNVIVNNTTIVNYQEQILSMNSGQHDLSFGSSQIDKSLDQTNIETSIYDSSTGWWWNSVEKRWQNLWMSDVETDCPSILNLIANQWLSKAKIRLTFSNSKIIIREDDINKTSGDVEINGNQVQTESNTDSMLNIKNPFLPYDYGNNKISEIETNDFIYTELNNDPIYIGYGIADFIGEETSELSFVKGEEIYITFTDYSGWWWGQNVEGKQGWFPRSYLKSITEFEHL